LLAYPTKEKKRNGVKSIKALDKVSKKLYNDYIKTKER
jgi:hypothetical protein